MILQCRWNVKLCLKRAGRYQRHGCLDQVGRAVRVTIVFLKVVVGQDILLELENERRRTSFLGGRFVDRLGNVLLYQEDK